MIEFKDVTKKYGKTIALDGISFSLSSGVYGLVGENGAGKTTIFKLLIGQVLADYGRILFRGENWRYDKTCIGYLPQNFSFYENLTVKESLEYIQLLRGEKPELKKKETFEWLQKMNLVECYKKKVGTLSGGMKQRLGIVQAFMSDPEIILLDEPTVGLDPKERLAFRNMVNEISEEKTILISTHMLDDVESTCESIICLNEGKLVFDGKIKDFKKSVNIPVYEASTDKENIMQTKGINVISLKRDGSKMIIRFIISDEMLFRSSNLLLNSSCRMIDMTLEDAYYIKLFTQGSEL